MRRNTDIHSYSRRRLVTAALVAVAIAATVLMLNDLRLRFESAGERLRISTDLTVDYLEQFLGAHRAAIASAADLSAVDDHWESRLGRLQARFPEFATLLAADRDGRIVAGWPQRRADGSEADWTTRRVADREYFRQAIATRQPYISNALQGRGFGSDPIIAVSAPLLGADGEPAMVLQGALLAHRFVETRAKALERRQTDLLLLDRDHRVIFASPGTGLTPLAEANLAREAIDDAEAATKVMRSADVRADAAKSLVAVGQTRFGWRVVLVQPVRVIYAEFLGDSVRLLLPALLAVLVALWGASSLARRLTLPIRDIAARMRQFAFDTTPQPIDAGRAPREIAELGESFNHLGERLGRAYRDVQQALTVQHRLRMQLEATVAEREQEIARRTEQLRLAVAALHEDSLTDALTGLGNYRAYRLALERRWEQACASGRPFSVISLDVDHFKAYNDHLGHPAGDACLRRIAGILRELAASDGAEAARSGGEEFVLLLSDTDLEAATQIAERARAGVEAADLAHADTALGRVTISLGCASTSSSAVADADALVAAADAALYRAKREGRNRVIGGRPTAAA